MSVSDDVEQAILRLLDQTLNSGVDEAGKRRAVADANVIRHEIDRLHQIAGQLAGGWLGALLDQRLDDGTPVLMVALNEDRELRDRFWALLGSRIR